MVFCNINKYKSKQGKLPDKGEPTNNEMELEDYHLATIVVIIDLGKNCPVDMRTSGLKSGK